MSPHIATLPEATQHRNKPHSGATDLLTKNSLDAIRETLEEKIEKRELELPLLPRVASEVIALTSDVTSDASHLSSLIHQDMALAAHILKIANCPVYMPRSPIVSLQQAVAWLGMHNLAQIALTVSMKNGAFEVQGYKAEIAHLWKHALASGLYGKEIARLRRHNVESAFLCGLLHTVGQPAVLRAIITLKNEQGINADWTAMYPLIQEYHVTVGIMIAEEWGLPEHVKEAIMHDSTDSLPSSRTKSAMIAALATRLATSLFNPEVSTEQEVRDHHVVQDLNLYPEDLDTLLSKGEAILAEADSMAI